MTDTLVLIDGHALVFRAFYGVPNLTTPKGELVNAVHGFTSMLFKVWRELKPKYVIATFDYSSKTFRKEKFPDYKGTRGPARILAFGTGSCRSNFQSRTQRRGRRSP